MNPVEEIKKRLDVADIVGSYISLTPAGANFRARCPFHNEKTPSFMVSREKQIWHCFGCDKGGDIITFVQEYENISFAEALRILAEKANVPLENRSYEKKVDYSPLYKINELATEYYQKILQGTSAEAKATLEYLQKRGLSSESIQKWHLGLATSGWDDLYLFLRKANFSDDQIFQAGLSIKKKSGPGYLDRFRQRLIFPILDNQGKAVAFTSRTLANIVFKEEDLGGKYINSPQTAIYDKSKVLYGWTLAKEAVRQRQYLIIVEGNMDAIMSQQSGTTNTVAVSGTAFTLDHIKLIKRYTNNLILAFDGDAAGSRAAFRSFALCWQEDMNLKIIPLANGQDPAELVRQNPQSWLKAVKEAVPIMDYYFSRILSGVDLQRADHKKIAVTKLLPIIKFLKSQVEQVHYLQKLSEKLQIPLNILQGDLEKTKSFIEQQPIKNTPPQNEREQKELWQLLSENLLAIALLRKNFIEKLFQELSPEALADNLQTLYRKAVIYYTKQQHLDNFADSSELSDSEKNDWIHLLMLGQKDYQSLNEKELTRDFDDVYKGLKLFNFDNEHKQLRNNLKQAELSNNTEEQDRILHQINLLNKEINKLHQK